MALRRLVREIEDIIENGKDDDILFIGPISNDSFFNWKVIIRGPKDTPYENGIFELMVNFSNFYPFKAPDVRFVTKIFHVNIFNDTGNMNSDLILLSNNSWCPALTFINIINSILDLLKNPVFELFNIIDPTYFKYLYNRDDYYKTAKEWTEKYANIYNKEKAELNKLNEDIDKVFNYEFEIFFLKMKLELFYNETKNLIDNERKKILQLKEQLKNNSVI